MFLLLQILATKILQRIAGNSHKWHQNILTFNRLGQKTTF